MIGVALGVACGSDPCTGPQCGDTASGGSGGSSSQNGTRREGPCTTSATCDTSHGFACTLGECRFACGSHFDCEGQGTCAPLLDDAGALVGDYCTFFEEPAAAGRYYTNCPSFTECDAEAGFACLGAGVGDADAYCSAGCEGDGDCPLGFYCDVLTDSNGDPVNYCVRRRFCSSCETDADCLTVPGQICARDANGDKICTELCDPNVDSCPWGNAAVCGVFDEELGVSTCSHRFGSCHGEGKSCEPCVRDSDCPLGFCTGSSYTSERWCVDTTIDCDCDGLETTQNICENGNGCPETPGGLSMLCFDDERFAGDPVAYSCFGATTMGEAGFLTNPQSGCWRPL